MTQKLALVVDDNADNAKVLAELLTLEGVTCTKVTDTTKLDGALRQVEKVDVAFIDLEMPGRNGYEVLDHLRQDARFLNVPIVVCSVHVSEINNARKKGFHSFLGKPLNADTFPDQLARILRGEAVWAINSSY